MLISCFVVDGTCFCACALCLFFLQAYTNELENEVEQLLKENARLKRQQEEVIKLLKVEFLDGIFLDFSIFYTARPLQLAVNLVNAAWSAGKCLHCCFQ